MVGTFRYTLDGDYTASNSGVVHLERPDRPALSGAYDGASPLTVGFETSGYPFGYADQGNGREYLVTPTGGVLHHGNAGFFFSVKGLAASATLSGGDRGDVLEGGRGSDTLRGGEGDDLLTGGASNDVLDGGAGTDTVSYAGSLAGVEANAAYGFARDGDGSGPNGHDALQGVENLIGSRFEDRLIGVRDRTSQLSGGAGNDVLGLAVSQDGDPDAATVRGVAFNGGAGHDTVTYAGIGGRVTVDLLAPETNDGWARGDTYASIETVVGTSERDDISGDNAANTLIGGAGSDVLDGRGGTDTVSYQTSSNGVFVDLSRGFDKQTGGYSDATGDRLVRIENLLGSSRNDTLIGDAQDNVLDGQSGSDTLRGGAGNDTLRGGDGDAMSGGAGNDRFHVFYRGDTVFEARNEGTDTVIAGVSYALAAGQDIERLVTASAKDTAPLNLSGNEFAQTLVGNAGANTLNGKAGADTLLGGAGQDTFYFNTKLAPTNIDRIGDFSGPDDTLRLNHAVFKGIALGALDASVFAANKDGVAKDAGDRIVYETDTGKLFFDADGSGGGHAVQFATLSNKAALSATDFVVA